MYVSAQGAQAQNKRMDVIANNLANVDTIGFKRELAVFQARAAEAIAQRTNKPGSGSTSNLGGGVAVRQTATDFSPGPIKKTGVVTDMALPKEGFFQIRDGQDTYLTRAGNFKLSARGELLTQQGHAVLSESGAPVVVPNQQLPWNLNSAGEIRQGTDVQRLAIVKPASLGDLAKMGANSFRPLAATQAVPLAQREVLGGQLEMSAVQPTTEMVDMIQSSRYLEANVNMMQTQDQLLNELVSKVLKS
jgi:flagellar basal body rod protein FlgG